MKKVLACLVIVLSLSAQVYAACSCPAGHHRAGCYNHPHYSSSSDNRVYLVRQDYSKTKQKFPNCTKHYMTVETFTSHYSDGTVRTFRNCTVYNSDDTVIAENCRGVKHIIYQNKHYFVIYQNGCYIIDGDGNRTTKRVYSAIADFKPNRLMVRYKKHYGIIDLNENVIVPIKYQKFIPDGNGIFVTKLNGYWGLLDVDNNVLVPNECDKIKDLYDTILLKRSHKYGLVDLNGKIILDIKYDKIKQLGDYIIVREGNKYFALDYDGDKINDFKYKKIKLKRNTLYGITDDKESVEIKKAHKQYNI